MFGFINVWFKARFVALLLSLSFLSPLTLALDDEQLVDVDFKELDLFAIVDDTTETLAADGIDHSLVQKNTFTLDGERYVRYQQYYQGLKVEGRTVVGHYGETVGEWQHEQGRFFGKIADEIKVPVDEEYLTDDYRESVTVFARNHFRNRMNIDDKVSAMDSRPLIWIDKDEEATLAYRVSFRVQAHAGPVRWPHYTIAADDNEILDYWDNVQGLYHDEAPGGNGKTGKYTYGQANLPSFSVARSGDYCLLGNSQVKVVSMNGGWWISDNPQPYTYVCDDNSGDPVNGAWSPENDAYVFANLVVSMFKNWYQTPVLALPDGTPRQLLVLVNLGKNYENAFWDGRYLAFGDGHNTFYPLVSVTIVAHELSHAFTSGHSNLVYANQSGAINEAFSDMAAIAAEAYLKSNNAKAYQSLIGVEGIDWRIGDRISKGNFAMRSMSNPAAYSSAACESRVAGCSRTWGDVVARAWQVPLTSRQGYIVHKGSGVMNRAFFNIVNALNGDVQRAFSLMVRANMTYWTSMVTFAEAACGVKQAAQIENISISIIQQAFEGVGVTPSC